jgi:hypothetical protein
MDKVEQNANSLPEPIKSEDTSDEESSDGLHA